MNTNYHIHKIDIKCPYCDNYCDSPDYHIYFMDDKNFEVECAHCGKNFYANASILYNSYSNCELNGKEHDLEQSVFQPKVYNCKNCAYHEVRK